MENSNLDFTFLDQILDPIEGPLSMPEPNSEIIIFEGNYTIIRNESEYNVLGKIIFKWIPITGVHFSGEIQNGKILIEEIKNNAGTTKIILNDLEFGEGLISNYNSSKILLISGIIHSPAVIGDSSIKVDKIKFCVPNLRNFEADRLNKISDSQYSFNNGRLTFENESYKIIIDKDMKFKGRHEALVENGGFNILNNGELICNKNPISFSESNEVFNCLSIFLSFLNGRRVLTFFHQGVHNDEVTWTDYSNYRIDQFKNVASFPSQDSITGLNELWQKFYITWQSPEDRFFLIYVIHWYTEANSSAGLVEGSIIMAQTAIELIYNWWIIEKKNLLVGKDSDSISASNKIRLLLSQMNINYLVPEAFVNLQKFIAQNNEIVDGPDAIVQIRNAIVHSQEEKRKKLQKIDHNATQEALYLYLWYIEMAMLKILDYNEIYFNRCSKERFKANCEEYVPWAIKKGA